MEGALNLCWFIAGHVSCAVLALAYARHTGLGDEKDHPFYKAGYKAGRMDESARTQMHQAQVDAEIAACKDRLARYEAALTEIKDAR